MRRFILLALTALINSVAWAGEPVRVKGVVRDAAGEPMLGVAVVEKGTNNGYVSSVDGEFLLDVQEGDTLQFSTLGYLKQELRVDRQLGLLNITLEVDPECADQVLVQTQDFQIAGILPRVYEPNEAQGSLYALINNLGVAMSRNKFGERANEGASVRGSMVRVFLDGKEVRDVASLRALSLSDVDLSKIRLEPNDLSQQAHIYLKSR